MDTLQPKRVCILFAFLLSPFYFRPWSQFALQSVASSSIVLRQRYKTRGTSFMG
jgi:hypothetical protein